MTPMRLDAARLRSSLRVTQQALISTGAQQGWLLRHQALISSIYSELWCYGGAVGSHATTAGGSTHADARHLS
jgi:hypothetical protein